MAVSGTALPHPYVVGGDELELITQAISIGDLAKKTMGLLPYAAYHEAAKRGQLVVLRKDDHVLAYALYRVARNRAALVHLCVHPDGERQGYARRLVEHIVQTTASYSGLMAKCRHSYGIDEMWLKLGFVQASERPGRGRERSPLVVWWRSYKHPDLFVRHVDPVLRAVLDFEVLTDMAINKGEAGRAASSLRSDMIYDQLELAITQITRLRIAQLEDHALRRRCTTIASTLLDPEPDKEMVASIEARLIKSIGRSAQFANDHTPLTEQEVRQAAEAVAAGVSVLIVRDGTRKHQLAPLFAEHCGLRVLDSVEVLLFLEELAHSQNFRPAALLGTAYSQQKLASVSERLPGLLAYERDGEDVNAFRRLLGTAISRGAVPYSLLDPDGNTAVLYAIEEDAGLTLTVPIIRVVESDMDFTLARQILFSLRAECRRLGKRAIRVTDPHPSAGVREAAPIEGYFRSARSWDAIVLDTVGDAGETRKNANAVLALLGDRVIADLPENLAGHAAAAVEHAWWPAKLADADLPNFVLPIHAKWATELLGTPPSIFPRPPELALSREHVYYRSPRPVLVVAPARVLWYLTTTGNSAQPAGIIGCSAVESASIDTWSRQYAAHRHLGVLTPAEVESIAKEGRVQAITFSDTEAFPHAVPLRRLQVLEKQFAMAIVPQGPRRLPPHVFNAILLEGRAGNGR